MSTVTVNSNAYSDDGTQSRDLTNGGHRIWWTPLLQDLVADTAAKQSNTASSVSGAATAVAATSSWGNSSLVANSTTTRIVGLGAKPFTIESGKGFVPGHEVRMLDKTAPANAPRYMRGVVTSYSGTALTVEATVAVGSGTYASWDIRVWRNANERMYSPKAGAYTIVASDRADLIDCTGTWTLTLAAAGSLGAGWYVYARNSGTAEITLTGTAGELIDGLTTFKLYPGEYRFITCDGTAFKSVVLEPFSVTFSSSGTFTKPPGYSVLLVEALGAGGGGQAGHLQGPSQPRSGGNGGGGGSYLKGWVRADALAASESVTIGAGGAGGLGQTGGGSPGFVGSVGGNTVFGNNLLTAFGGGAAPATLGYGGTGGGAGSAGPTTGLASLPAIPIDGSGATFGGGSGNNAPGNRYSVYGGGAGGAGSDAGNSLAATAGGGSIYGGSGGGGGAGLTSINTGFLAAAGGSWKSTLGGGSAAGASGASAGAGGTSSALGPILAGVGGGGGGVSTTGASYISANGGNGGPGCGGGGGGGTSAAFVGAGGNGGNGLLRITGHT